MIEELRPPGQGPSAASTFFCAAAQRFVRFMVRNPMITDIQRANMHGSMRNTSDRSPDHRKTHLKMKSLGFILDRGQRKRGRETRGIKWLKIFKRFKYIWFKEFRAPGGWESLSFARQRSDFVYLYRESENYDR